MGGTQLCFIINAIENLNNYICSMQYKNNLPYSVDDLNSQHRQDPDHFDDHDAGV